jgi:hypothetical protein
MVCKRKTCAHPDCETTRPLCTGSEDDALFEPNKRQIRQPNKDALTATCAVISQLMVTGQPIAKRKELHQAGHDDLLNEECRSCNLKTLVNTEGSATL